MICTVIVAGGTGTRMKAAIKKQYLTLDGVPIVGHTLKAFDRYPDLEKIILVVPEEDLQWCRSEIVAPLTLDHHVQLVAGGRQRQGSVRNGLAAVGVSDGVVMIHDGVRPFVRPSLIDACLNGVKATGACIPAITATDSLKRVDESGVITGTVDRRQVRLAQTPQTFAIDLIRHAHQFAENHGFTATDDASVAEFAGEQVIVVPGDRDNIKITSTLDLTIARAILEQKRVATGP